MILKKDEFMEKLKLLTEGKTDDETLKIIEDFNDTINAVNTDSEEVEAIKEEYEQKLADLDTSWREKYKDAFFNGVEEKEELKEPEDPEEKEPETYEDLFKEVK